MERQNIVVSYYTGCCIASPRSLLKYMPLLAETASGPEDNLDYSVHRGSDRQSPLYHFKRPMSRSLKFNAMEPATPIVKGLEVTSRMQCSHWHSPRDIIAIRHKCCGEYYACISCHDELVTHPSQVWSRDERSTKAVLCGSCHRELSIAEYLACSNVCPGCKADFNPGCSYHYHLYFAM
ncbi:hypothetical protein BJ170DRAFT_597389 [Xylariales sp. AK1849]|nr:hypothetical protein BJ170DRAFT_597389 [Xylariales sp. AK1849]